jgi:hypothetical protein
VRLFKTKPLAELTTVILQFDDDCWECSWVADERPPYLAEGRFASLELALEAVAETFSDFAATREVRPGTVLQYAIYPWTNGAGQIFDIGGGLGAWAATDIKGSGLRVTAATVPALIAAIEETPGAILGDAMLRWERPVPLSA